MTTEFLKLTIRILRDSIILSLSLSFCFVMLGYALNFDGINTYLGQSGYDGWSAVAMHAFSAGFYVVLVFIPGVLVLFPVLMIVQLLGILRIAGKLKPEYLRSTQTRKLKSELSYNDLFDVCQDAAEHIGVKIREMDSNRGSIKGLIKARGITIGLSEDVAIDIKKNGNVTITSASHGSFEACNAGRNVKHVSMISKYLLQNGCTAK